MANATDVQTWSWSFQNGTPNVSSSQSPIVIYNTAGVDSVTLIVSNIAGSDTLVMYNYITVNGPPTVTLSALPSVCIDAAPFTLSGGSPAGGIYTDMLSAVTANTFNPNTAGAGTDSIYYTYTGTCGTTTATQAIQVNALPVVTVDYVSAGISIICEFASAVTLSGGSPAGGTYSGTGVFSNTIGSGTPGTFAITYTYTDVNGCTNSAFDSITIEDCPGVHQLTMDNEITIYPNPANGAFTIASTNTKIENIKVVNLLGEEILAVTPNNQSTIINNQFTKGIYFVQVTDANKNIINKKIIIQ